MKVKTGELTGAALDWAVAQCECVNVRFGFDDNCPEYSTDWAQGGPIIERGGIEVGPSFVSGRWLANHRIQGPTPLIAAMRCYVASKLGNEVEIPEEFIQEKKMNKVNRLEAMIERAYALAGQVIDDNRDEKVLQVLAEEVSGECGEFLALWNEDYGSFGDPECMDSELVELVEKLKEEGLIK